MNDSSVEFIALCLVQGVGGVTLRALLERFGSIPAILAASAADLQTVSGVGPRTAAGIRAVDVPRTAAEMDAWKADGISVLTWFQSPPYPGRLSGLRDAPPILFCRGALTESDDRAVAVVGTRYPTGQSRSLAEKLGHELARRGWTVVSGLARGVDLAAHNGAVRGGRTVAVLGSGLYHLPPNKKALANHILANGAILSEMHPGISPNPATLVARNRLITGLSRAAIVVEAGEESGSLYAARFALKQGRPVYAVDNGSAGNTQLLNNGARALKAGFSVWDDLASELDSLP